MSQISSEYVIPEGVHNPNSQDTPEGSIVVIPEMTDENAIFESQVKESNIASARLEMGGKAIFGSQPEQITDPTIARLYDISEDLQKARAVRLRAA